MDDKIMFVIIFSGIWGLIGIIFLIIGSIILNNRRKKEINCISTTFGKVKDIIKHESYDTNYSCSYYPVFEYNIGDLKFIKKSAYGSSKTEYAIGQEIEVCYNPEDYHEYYVVGETVQKKLGIMFTIFGIAAIIIAILSAIFIL